MISTGAHEGTKASMLVGTGTHEGIRLISTGTHEGTRTARLVSTGAHEGTKADRLISTGAHEGTKASMLVGTGTHEGIRLVSTGTHEGTRTARLVSTSAREDTMTARLVNTGAQVDTRTEQQWSGSLVMEEQGPLAVVALLQDSIVPLSHCLPVVLPENMCSEHEKEHQDYLSASPCSLPSRAASRPAGGWGGGFL